MTDREKLKILIVDDHDVVGWGLAQLLGSQPWVESAITASTPEEAIERVGQSQPDVAMIDLFLDHESGTELCTKVRELSPSTKVLLLSGAGAISPPMARAAGASGFITKDWNSRDVVGAVRMVSLNMEIFGRPGEERSPEVELTPREQEVIGLIADGATNREVAEQLEISTNTVKEYTSAIFRKLDVKNRTGAVNEAKRLGLLVRRA